MASDSSRRREVESDESNLDVAADGDYRDLPPRQWPRSELAAEVERLRGERETISKVVQPSWHLTRAGANRARRLWLKGAHGRDAYVLRRGWFHWECRRIDYEPLDASLVRRTIL